MKVRMRDDEGSIELGKVKPCPFCGKVDDLRVTSRKTYEELVAEHGSSLVKIECKNCDLEVNLFEIPDNNFDFGLGMLVAKWNNRK